MADLLSVQARVVVIRDEAPVELEIVDTPSGEHGRILPEVAVAPCARGGAVLHACTRIDPEPQAERVDIVGPGFDALWKFGRVWLEAPASAAPAEIPPAVEVHVPVAGSLHSRAEDGVGLGCDRRCGH